MVTNDRIISFEIINAHKEEIYTIYFSEDFFIEAFTNRNDNELVDFWLCRKNYGKKIYIIGLNCETYIKYKNNQSKLEYLSSIISKLLYNNEISLENFNELTDTNEVIILNDNNEVEITKK